MATRTSNGCLKAERKGYADLDSKFRTTPRFIATIDFGTTHCSIAYLLRPDEAIDLSEADPTLLSLDEALNKRVPSCILFNPNGNRIAFGYEAREQFRHLNHKMRPKYHYFEHVKRQLQHDKVQIIMRILTVIPCFV